MDLDDVQAIVVTIRYIGGLQNEVWEGKGTNLMHCGNEISTF